MANPAVSVLRSIAKTIKKAPAGALQAGKKAAKSKSAWTAGDLVDLMLFDATETGHSGKGEIKRIEQEERTEKFEQQAPIRKVKAADAHHIRQSQNLPAYKSPKKALKRLSGYPRAVKEIAERKDKSGRTPEDVVNYYERTSEYPASSHMKDTRIREYIFNMVANREVAAQMRMRGGG